MFRSENMSLNQIMFAKESMWDTMNLLASSEKVMTVLPTKQTSNNIALYALKLLKRCQDLSQHLTNIQKTLNEFKWPIASYKKNAQKYIKDIDDYCLEKKINGNELFEKLEIHIKEKWSVIREHLENYRVMVEQRIGLFEKYESFIKIDGIVPLFFLSSGNLDDEFLKRERENNVGKRFHSILGLVETEVVGKLRKILFRIARDNCVLKSLNVDEIKDEIIQDYFKGDVFRKKEKTLIFLIFPKTEKEVIVTKVTSVLTMFHFKKFDFPKISEKHKLIEKIQQDLSDNKKIILKTKSEINKILQSFSKPNILPRISFLKVLQLIINREQNFSKQLINIEEKDGFYQLKIWVPESFLSQLTTEVQNIRLTDKTFIKPKIIEISNSQNLQFDKSLSPPSRFKLNAFTAPFQMIIDTYGIPRYKEINPGLFTVVSFPFLFGMMFGDIGHGLMLLCFGVYLIFFLNDKMGVLNQMKFLVFMMGIFAVFCGFIYNEFFSIPFLLQPSCYDPETFERYTENCTYAFGIDWIWGQSGNETGFVNSFKMKVSIIVGVIHMLFGIFLKGLNGIYFNSAIDVFFEALPQFIFMLVTFGYMVFCIITKWLQSWQNRESISIIQLFINFNSVKSSLFLTPQTQQSLQLFFILLVFLTTLLMLIPKPILLYQKQKKKNIALLQKSDSDIDQSHKLITSDEETSLPEPDHRDSFGELFIHQLIETIEFVLGSVSNTASYLRLWALSLAHGQLARVFYEMIFGWTIQKSESVFFSFFVIVLGFVFFFFVTLAVIMVMDTMECFLHALRLHWVEFQNKFYKGDGKLFVAFKHSFVEE